MTRCAAAIAEFGAGNRVLDMIVYRKGGQEPAVHQQQPGVMKIPTSTFASAIRSRHRSTARLPACRLKVTSMTNIEQMDKLDDQNVIVLLAPRLAR